MTCQKILCILFLLLLASCGVKGDLQPKGIPEPTAPSALSLRQQGNIFELNWDIPTTNQDGSRLTDLAGFRVDLYTFAHGQYCPECKDQETVATIKIDQPEPATIVNGLVYLRLPHPGSDHGARYRIFPFTRSGKSGPYVEARQNARQAPAAPVNIRTNAVDRGVNLLWALPEGIQKSGDLLGVNIYRGEAESNLSPEPINAQPITGNNFDDFGLDNGKSYQYGLRTVIRIDKTVIESAMSEIAIATPKTGL